MLGEILRSISVFHVALPDVFQPPRGLNYAVTTAVKPRRQQELPQGRRTVSSLSERRHDGRIGNPPRRLHHPRVHVGVLRDADWADRHPPQAHSFLQVSRGEGELEQC